MTSERQRQAGDHRRPRSGAPIWIAIGALVGVIGLVGLSRGMIPGQQVGGGSGPTHAPSAHPSTSSPPLDPARLEGALPWLDQPVTLPPWPTPTTVTPPPGLSLCLASGLTARLSDAGLAMGTTYFRVTMTSVDASTCYLQGTPGAQVIDGHGDIVFDGATANGPDLEGPRISAGDPVVAVRPGMTIDVDVGWSDWCGPPIADPISLALVLPGGAGRLVPGWAPGSRPLQDPVTCLGGPQSDVSVDGPFEPPVGSAPTAPEPTPEPLQVAIDLGRLTLDPPSAGAPLRYAVTLTNTSGAALDVQSFADGRSCPVYEELLIADAPVLERAFVVDCSPLGPLAPGASVSFAMDMPTTGLKRGTYILSWVLAPQRSGPSTKAPLTFR